jgi:hypothetical protein
VKFWGKRIYLHGLDCLVPSDDASRAIFEKIPSGKDVEIDAVQKRNPQFHRLVFALFGLIAKAFDQDMDDVRKRLLEAIGESHTVTFPDGSSRVYANSIAYSSMEEIKFGEVFEKLVKATYLIYGTFPSDIKREIDALLAPKTERRR